MYNTLFLNNDYLNPIFKIADGLYVSNHLIYGIVFNDLKGYKINRELVLRGEL